MEMEKLMRGVFQVVTPEELEERLTLKKPLKVKLGIDPTSPELHLGHLVLFRKMRIFQEMGGEVIFIIGDYTGRIGDPSGRSSTRLPLSLQEIEENARTYQEQALPFLIPDQTRFTRNSQWLSTLTFEDLLRIASQFTVAQMLQRDDFHQRFRQGNPLGIHEILYPLFQAYDSVAIQADVEIGGADQLFNLLIGRDLQRAYGQEPQIVFTLPLLEGTDGVKKMSKSEGNVIALQDSPENMFGKIMSLPDEVMWKYFLLLTDVPEKEIAEMRQGCEKEKINPRDVKQHLAGLITEQVYGKEKALRAKEHFIRLFVEKEAPEEMPVYPLSRPRLLIEVMVEAGLAKSRGEAKRLIRAGGVSLNAHRIENLDYVVKPGEPAILKVGKRHFLKLL